MVFPEPFATLLRVFSVTQLNFLRLLSIECIDPTTNYHSQSVITSIIPILIGALNWAVYLIRKAMGGDKRKVAATPKDAEAGGGSGGGGDSGGEAALFSEHMGYFLLLSYVCLPAVATAQFRGLNCGELEGGSGRRFLRVDPSIDCDDTAQAEFEPVSHPLQCRLTTLPSILSIPTNLTEYFPFTTLHHPPPSAPTPQTPLSTPPTPQTSPTTKTTTNPRSTGSSSSATRFSRS